MKNGPLIFSTIIALVATLPALAQVSWVQDINLESLNSDRQISITVLGVKPSPCLDIVGSPLVEESMVTVNVQMRFPEGVTRCVGKVAPFTVTSIINTPPPGEYEVQVIVNGEMQIQYRGFNVAKESNAVTI